MKRLANLRYFLCAAAFSLATFFFAACTDPPAQYDPDAHSDTGQTPTECTDRCQAGERICLNESTSLECARNQNGCLDFMNPTACSDDRACFNGTCIQGQPTCDDECAPGDLPRCNTSGQLESCADHQQTGCLTYGAPTPCSTGMYCDAASNRCIPLECEDECQEGETTCELHRITTCKKDALGCLSFVDSQECAPGKSCTDGQCQAVQTCASECTDSDIICNIDGDARICGDWHGDGCFSFSEALDCGVGQTCRGDDCVPVDQCQDQCLAGESVCVGNKIATCDDHDLDGCVEFDEPAACQAPGTTCQLVGAQSLCRPSPQTGAVLLNEIFYDPMGPDMRATDATPCQGADPACTSPTFIELTGPPGLLIAGYKVDMINGADGKTYNSATLPPDARLDGRGFAVLAMDQADRFLSSAAPFYTNVYYILMPYVPGQDALQNGPDSVVLYNPAGQTADAVGYDQFTTAQLPHFRGNGQPAPRSTSGRSLGRVFGQTNTNNNANDFKTFYPTPGMPNQDIFITEVYVNQPGANDGSETFIELASPILGWEDLSLDGYVLRAIAGHNGKDYLFTGTTPGIVLNGKMLSDATNNDGFFVLCHKDAKPPLRPLCTLHYDGTPFYSGPDNFVLEYQQHPIDSIGYGTFGPASTFVGEGRPAPYALTDAGRSLARGRHSDPNTILDTNDNSVDFHRVSPSPGADNNRP